MNDTLHVTVDQSLCIGSGQCALRAPAVFASSPDDGLAVVVNPMPPSEEHADVEDAAVECPVGAITVARSP